MHSKLLLLTMTLELIDRHYVHLDAKTQRHTQDRSDVACLCMVHTHILVAIVPRLNIQSGHPEILVGGGGFNGHR
jgi:hypothetical protein